MEDNAVSILHEYALERRESKYSPFWTGEDRLGSLTIT